MDLGGGGAEESPEGAWRNRVSSTAVLTESRRGNPAKSLKLGNACYARDGQEMAKSVNHRYSVTGPPL